MEEGMVVRIVEVCNISPSSHSSSQSQISLPLSAFDWLSLRTPPIQRLLFYPIPLTHDSFTHSILPKLKLSLSLTLTHFLPLAGSLIWPDDSPLPFILYSPNDVVSFTVADTHSDFHHVSGDHPRLIKDSLAFIPTIQSSDSCVPIMAIQVTHFPNHGFSIGLATHHVIFDGRCFNLFLKSWAYISKLINNTGGNQMDSHFCPLPPELSPSFERAPNVLRNPFDYVPKTRSVEFHAGVLPPSNWLLATFKLTPTHIQNLKKKVLEEVDPEEEELHLSTFVVTYAYVLICLMKLKEEECKEFVHFVVPADARGLLDPPISNNYFGNCVALPSMIVEAKEFREESGFPKIAKKISHLILEFRRTDHTVRKSTIDELILFHTKYPSRTEVMFVTSSPKFKVYETDFGWGNPKKVEMVSLKHNLISLMDTADGTGVQIGLVFPNHRQWDVFTSLFAQGLL